MTARRLPRLAALTSLAALMGMAACQDDTESQTEFIEASTYLQCGEGYDNTSEFWYKWAENGIWCDAVALDGDTVNVVEGRYPGLVVDGKSTTWLFHRKAIVKKLAKVITVGAQLSLEETGQLEAFDEAEVAAFTRSMVALAGATSKMGQYKLIDDKLYLRRSADGRHHGIMHIPDETFSTEVFDSPVGWDLVHNIDFGAALFQQSWALAVRKADEAPCITGEVGSEDYLLNIARSAFSIYDGGSDSDVCRWVEDRTDADADFNRWYTWEIDDKKLTVDYATALPDVADIDFAGILGRTSALDGFTCGDSMVRGDETCDDGNTTSGDGCDENCAVETGYTCQYEPSICTTVCGDGVISAGSEGCDDGNTSANDGCSAGCQIETGYACSGTPSSCSSTCGDGDVAAGDEGCDDGNTASGDGCSASCQVEPGYTCGGDPSVCVTECGDGQVNGDEECDDANVQNGDGCDAGCGIEAGYACSGQPSVCGPKCGDGVVAEGIEACDDANEMSGDGCSASCQVEPGFECGGAAPSSCSAVCGDGQIVGDEECDDDNLSSFDGCSQTCRVETGYSCNGEPSECRKSDDEPPPGGQGEGGMGSGRTPEPPTPGEGRDPETEKPEGHDPEGENPELNGNDAPRRSGTNESAATCSYGGGPAPTAPGGLAAFGLMLAAALRRRRRA